MKKKLLMLVLAACLVLSMIPSMAFADLGTELQGDPPDNIRIAKASPAMSEKINSGNITVDDLISEEGDWSNSLEAQNGTTLEAYLAVRHNGQVILLTGECIKIPQDNTNSIGVSYSSENKTFTLSFKQVGNTWIEATYDGENYELGISISNAGESSDNSGLTLRWDDGNGNPMGEAISDGDTIEIEEGCGYSLLAYIDGVATAEQDFWYEVETTDERICNAGFSPDNKYLEAYLSSNAVAGQQCTIKVMYGDEVSPRVASFNVKVIPGVKLKLEDGSFIVANTETIDKGTVKATVWYNEAPLKDDDFRIGTVGKNAVYQINALGESVIEITTVGNGSADFSITHKLNESETKEYNFTWTASNVSDSDPNARNVSIKINGETRQIGGSFNFRPDEELKGSVSLNGAEIKGYKLQMLYGEQEKEITIGEDGSFALGSLNEGWYELIVTIGEDDNVTEAAFNISVSKPTDYILQFYRIEKNDLGTWNNIGYSTFGAFKGGKQTIDTKFVVTDENMRLIDTTHFVDSSQDNWDNWSVQYYDPFMPNGSNEEPGGFVTVNDNENPFTFAEIKDGTNRDENMISISYDPSKDWHGPVYRLVYNGEDKYLNSTEEIGKSNHVILYTRRLIDVFTWDKLGHDENNSNHYCYDAYLENHDGFNKEGLSKNNDCDVKSTAVELPQEIFEDGDNNISISNDTSLDVRTDLATVTLDDDVLTQVKDTGKDVTLDVVKLEADDKTADEYKNMGLGDDDVVLDLTLEYGDGTTQTQTISNFGDGKVTVKLEYKAKDASKTPKVYYIDQNGNKTEVECTYDAENGTISFDTNHFSVFAVVEEEAGTDSGTGGSGATGGSGSSGGGAAIGAGTGSSTEIGGTDAKTEEELKAEQLEKAQQGAAKAAMKARSSKTSKGNIKIVFIPDEETESFIKEMEALGYTVKYKFYRSTKKTSGYKAMLTKSSRVYTNTSGVKGKMYYYKTRVQIFDKDGKLIAQTALKQCKYANRLWTK